MNGSGWPAFDLEHGDVGARVGADHLGRQDSAVIERDAERLRAFHHVVVGDDDPVRADDEARATRFDRVLTLLRHIRDHLVERERKLLHLTALLLVLQRCRGGLQLIGDGDDRWLDLGHQVGEVRQGVRLQLGVRRVDRGGIVSPRVMAEGVAAQAGARQQRRGERCSADWAALWVKGVEVANSYGHLLFPKLGY